MVEHYLQPKELQLKVGWTLKKIMIFINIDVINNIKQFRHEFKNSIK